MAPKSGFTLIELLLVIVIIGVIAGISVPSFVRSMQGNRLRSAARMVASAGRYARSMAVLHQRPMAITFGLADGTILVDLATVRPAADGEDIADVPARTDMQMFSLAEGAGAERGGADLAPDPSIRITRTLDGIRIARVELDPRGWGEERAEISGQHARMVYASNGRCQPYQVVLQDDQGLQLFVVVDALGGAKIQER